MAYTAGKGTVLQLSIASTFTTIPQVSSITPPQLEMGTAETTHLTSTAREHIATIPDPGEVSFNLEWDPANSVHQQLFTNFSARTVGSWKIILTNAEASEIAFSGFIMNFGVDELNVDSIVSIPCTIKVTGMPTITV